MRHKLFAGPEIMAAEELDCLLQYITRESVWLGSQVSLLAATPRDDTGHAGTAHDHPVRRVIWKYDRNRKGAMQQAVCVVEVVDWEN